MPTLLTEFFGSDNPLTFIVWPIFIGIVLGILFSILQSLLIGRFIRRLLADNICSPSEAKTLAELGFAKNFFLRLALRRGATLRRLVLLQAANKETDPALLSLWQQDDAQASANTAANDEAETVEPCADESESADEDEEEERTLDPILAAIEGNRAMSADLSCDKWYLNPKQLSRAEVFSARGASPLLTVFAIVALLGLAIAGFYVIPFITDLVSSIF